MSKKKQALRRDNGWSEYYKKQKPIEPPNELLHESILVQSRLPWKKRLRAIDLGAGRGHDTYALLKAGYSVLAIDASTEAFRLMRPIIRKDWHSRLTTALARFEKLPPLGTASLINARRSLFFCKPNAFKSVFKEVLAALEPGGLFCGNFLGPNDDWHRSKSVTTLSKHEVKRLFKDCRLLLFAEREDDLGTLTGKKKHWHIFFVIAEKR